MTPAQEVASGQLRTRGPETESLWEISTVFHLWPQDGRSEKNGHEDRGAAAPAPGLPHALHVH